MTRNKSFLAAYRKGKRAAQIGKALEACPYEKPADKSWTWAAVFKSHWERGWQDGQSKLG